MDSLQQECSTWQLVQFVQWVILYCGGFLSINGSLLSLKAQQNHNTSDVTCWWHGRCCYCCGNRHNDLPGKGGASSLKLERTDGSAQSTNIAIVWLACFWLLANSCLIRIRITHSRWRAVILVNSPHRWYMCCSICFFLHLICCKRLATNPKHMPGKETEKCNGTEVFFWVI